MAVSAGVSKSDLKALGKRIRKYRKDNDMTIAAFCKRAGLSSFTLHKLEAGTAAAGTTQKTIDSATAVLNGGTAKAKKKAKKKVRRRQVSQEPMPDLSNMAEVEKALGLDSTSSASPLTITHGGLKLTVELVSD